MQLMISIPDKLFESIKQQHIVLDDVESICNCIAHGEIFSELQEYKKEYDDVISVLEDIKTEIRNVQGFAFRTKEEYEGLHMALEIIDEVVARMPLPEVYQRR